MRPRGRLICDAEGCRFTPAVGSPAELARLLRKHFRSAGHMVTVTLEKEVPDETPVGISLIQLRAEIVRQLALAVTARRLALARESDVSMHFLRSWSPPDDPVKFDWPERHGPS